MWPVAEQETQRWPATRQRRRPKHRRQGRAVDDPADRPARPALAHPPGRRVRPARRTGSCSRLGDEPGRHRRRNPLPRRDPVVPQPAAARAAAAIALAAKSRRCQALAVARGPGQDIGVDLRTAPQPLCPFYDASGSCSTAIAVATANVSPAFGFPFYRTADDRWVMPLNRIRRSSGRQKLLGNPRRLRRRHPRHRPLEGARLEEAGAAAGVVAPCATTEELRPSRTTGRAGGLPVIEITKIADSEPEPLGPADDQAALRVPGAGHGPCDRRSGRGPGRWRCTAPTYSTCGVPVSSNTTTPMPPPTSVSGRPPSTLRRRRRPRIRGLLKDADGLSSQRRPGYLDRIGLSAEAAAAVRPGIIPPPRPSTAGTARGPTGWVRPDGRLPGRH